MTRLYKGLTAALVGAGLALCCGSPQEHSGTSTNWYSLCDESAECGSELACICGKCTRACDDQGDCGDGVCASPLSSVIQCNGVESGLICVEANGCREMNLPANDTLGAATTPDCAQAGALFCENYEEVLSPEFATAYSLTANGDEARQQDCQVHQGQGALRLSSDRTEWVQTRARLPATVSEGPLYLRFYAYVSSAYPDPEEFLVLAELWDQEVFDEEKLSVEIGSNSSWRVIAGPAMTPYGNVAGSLIKDQWSCIELDLDLNAAGALKLRVDGVVAIDEVGIVTQPSAPFQVLTLGAVPNAALPGYDIYLDDVVLATSPIGCL